ncbi:MAG: hypothetical protein L6R42_004494 [Xanthoria sp. 1 TBL-2021]|nr:MAG: hypothetical protein L6R42_004494 [Xanthoria sp. 1 TBL-2021]
MGTFKEGLSRNIYRDVLADLVPSLKVESDLRTQKRPKYEHYYVGGRTSEQTDVDFIEPIEVADLLDHCRTMSLAEEREALMDQLVVASKWADPSAFGKMFIPLLKRMVELSQSANLSLTNTIPRPFFKSIIDAYVLRYVRPEPEKPRDWAQARTGCRNGCGDCSQLNSFLTNPQERTRGFAMAEKRRRHLANQLSYSGCTLDTVHRGIPYTLVVTKTEKKWHEHHKAWRERCRVAGKSFISLGIEALQKILGEDYERAVDLKSRKAGSAADRKPGAAVETPARSLTRKTPVSTMNQPVPFPTAILAKAQQAARRSPLGAVTQSLAPSTNVLPNKPRRSVSKVEIIDLTIE